LVFRLLVFFVFRSLLDMVRLVCAFKVPATTEIDTRSLHDALPILAFALAGTAVPGVRILDPGCVSKTFPGFFETLARLGVGLRRSEEHTSELQSRENLVCRLLLEKKKQYDVVLFVWCRTG